MEGTIFISGIEIKAFFVVGLGVTCCILVLSTIIFHVLWTKEVIRRTNQSRKLLEDIKFSFRNEITTAVSGILVVMEGVLVDFERGKYSVFLKNSASKLSKEFSFLEGISSLCDHLKELGADIKRRPEIENVYSEGDGAEIEAYISSISTSINNMGGLVGGYEVKNIREAILQCSGRDMLIEGLRNNVENLKQYVSGLNKSKEE